MTNRADWILGIETSCDETAAAVVARDGSIRSNVIRTQIDEHAVYGGIVPEVAARAHDRNLQPVLATALHEAGVTDPATQIAAVAVTIKPGLIGALLVGLNAAKTLAWTWGVPLIAVDHLHGHLHTARQAALLESNPLPADEPLTAMIVSGGHTAIYDVTSPIDYTRIGSTRDDAAGEAFDKAAALLDLTYPGGPSIQKAAEGGDSTAIKFPRSLRKDDTYDFSFSGVKTSLYYYLHGQADGHGKKLRIDPNRPPSKADTCASYQAAIGDILVEKAVAACLDYGRRTLAIVGGVAANRYLRELAERVCADRGLRLLIPPMSLCTDNAAMIAGVAWPLFEAGHTADLTIDANPAKVR